MTLPDPIEDERPTYEPVHIANVLAVGCSEAVLARCWAAAVRLDVEVRSASPLLAASIAAARRPLAIVLPNELHARNADEFDALARDVRAVTVRVDEEISSREIEAMLAPAIRAYLRGDVGRTGPSNRPRTSSSVRPGPPVSERPPPSMGRYALVRSEPPPPCERASLLPEPPRSGIRPTNPSGVASVRPPPSDAARSGMRSALDREVMSRPTVSAGIKRG